MKSSGKLPKKIIVPLDGSEFSFRAADYAINLARLTDAEIICIHVVVDLPYIEYMRPGIITVSRYIEEARKQAEEWYSQVRRIAEGKKGEGEEGGDRRGDIKITSDTIFNPPSIAESIISYAAEQKADLIVIGTRGRGGLKRLVLGSVASGVVSHATCPVLVVR
jgi:nucleotide-binding universal stress UspA family protein